MSDSVRPHRWQPTRLPRPWDSPGKNTGVGCHFLLHCRKMKSEVAQSCPTLPNPMDCSLPGSPVHGIVQGRVMPLAGFIFFVCSEFYVYFFPSKIKFCCSGYDFTLDFFVVISSTLEPGIIFSFTFATRSYCPDTVLPTGCH